MRARSVSRAAAVVAITTVCVAGCSRDAAPDPVSSKSLQSGLAEKLVQSGTPARWVDCPEPLPSEVGARVRCEVTFPGGDAVTAVLTTIRVDGGKAEWEISEAQLSKDQVAKRVSAMTGNSSVDCDSGMSSRVGSWVSCRATLDGVPRREIVEVTQAKGLIIKLKATPFLPAKQVEDRLGLDLIAVHGRKPDQTVCEGDLPGTVGSVVTCVVTYGDNPDPWTARVTGVSGGVINFTIIPGKRPAAPQGDQCPGCAG